MKFNLTVTLEESNPQTGDVEMLNLKSTDTGSDHVLLQVNGQAVVVTFKSLKKALEEVENFNALYKPKQTEGNVDKAVEVREI